MSEQNGRHRRFRVPHRAGQWVVRYDIWQGEVDGPFQKDRDGYSYAVEGRVEVTVFGNYSDAYTYADRCIAENEEEFGDI